jgi:hypothetical protein
MNHTEIDKAEATHAEYGHDDNDPTIHTPKENEYAAGDYLHRGTSFEKKVLRKIDLRLVPVLCELIFDLVVQADSRPAFMYACSLIDRTNLPWVALPLRSTVVDPRNARLAGMDRALGTNLGDRYSIITLLCKLVDPCESSKLITVFPPYIITEIPGNMALKRGIQ